MAIPQSDQNERTAMTVAQIKITTKISKGFSSQKLVGIVETLALNGFSGFRPQDITSFSYCTGVILVHSSSSQISRISPVRLVLFQSD